MNSKGHAQGRYEWNELKMTLNTQHFKQHTTASQTTVIFRLDKPWLKQLIGALQYQLSSHLLKCLLATYWLLKDEIFI